MYEYNCTVVRVVDADTMYLDVDLGCDVHILMTVRLNGIDAPEMRTDAGKQSRTQAALWLSAGKKLRLTTIKDTREKFGRYLGIIYRDDEAQSLNTWLVANGYAKPYAGGAR